MKTLPTNVNNGRAGSSEPIYLIRLIPNGGDGWSELRWATKAVTITGWGAFLGGRIAKGGLPVLEQSFNWFKGGGITHQGNFTIKLLNQDKYQDTLGIGEGTNNYENRTLNVYIVFANGSLSTSDCLLLQSGVVSRISYNIEYITIECVDSLQFVLGDIATDTISGKDVPQGNEGQIIPLVYGKCYRGADFDYNNVNKFPVIKKNKAKEEFYISQNQALDIVDWSYSYAFVYDEDSDTHIKLRWGTSSSPQETITYGRPTKIEFPRGYILNAYCYKQMTGMGSQTNPTTLDGSDAIDSNDTSYVTVGNSQKLYFRVRIPTGLFTIKEDTNIRLVVDFGTVTGAGTWKLRYYNADWGNGTGKFSDGKSDTGGGSLEHPYYVSGTGDTDYSAHGKDESQADQNDDWTPEEINTYEWGIECDANVSVQLKNIRIDIMNAVIGTSPEKGLRIPKGEKAPRRRRPTLVRGIAGTENQLDNITVQIKGAKFGAWVDEGVRNNGYNQNDLIENPAYIIEEILRTECGLATADIDIDSFDAIGNTTDGTRKDWKFAGVVDETQPALEIIDKICQEANLIFCSSWEGKAKLIDISPTTYPTAHTLNLFKLTDPDSGRSSFGVKLSSIEDLYSEYYINWAKNFCTGNYDKQDWIMGKSATANYYPYGGYSAFYTKARQVVTKFNKIKKLELNCDWVQESVANEAIYYLMTKLVNLFYRQRHIYNFITTLEALDIELGDCVNISHPLLSSGLPSKKEIITSIKINCNKDEIYLEAIEYET